jgi:hypothetical protein
VGRRHGVLAPRPRRGGAFPRRHAEVAVDLRLGGRARVQCANRRAAWLGARCQVFDAGGGRSSPRSSRAGGMGCGRATAR